MNLRLMHSWLLLPCLFGCGAAPAQAQEKKETDAGKHVAQQKQAPATVASAFIPMIGLEEYELRSAAEAMPEEKYGFRPAEGRFKDEKPLFGPSEVRTFAEQVKHVACGNFAFSAELDGKEAPAACDKGGPSPAKTRAELIVYLRDSFVALKKSIGAIDDKNKLDPIEGPYGGPNSRLGIAAVALWHAADHYGQMVIYMRLNGIVPPASRPNPPKRSGTP